MTASLALARQGFDAYLVEKEDELGGNLRYELGSASQSRVLPRFRRLSDPSLT